MANDEYMEAVAALRVAENHFEYADPDHIEAAIYELKAAESKVEAAVRQGRAKYE